MKGIKLCAECANYSKEKHRCTLGATKEDDPRNPFYDDCPLPEVAPVVHARWLDCGDFCQCSNCDATRLKEIETYYGKAMWVKSPYCPACGAEMDIKPSTTQADEDKLYSGLVTED